MLKGRADYLAIGDWNAICDVCGAKYKASQLLLRWDGMRVCKRDYEERQPLTFVRPITDQVAVPWSRPNTGYTDDTVTTITAVGTTLILQTEIPIDATSNNVTVTLPLANATYTIGTANTLPAPYAYGLNFQRLDVTANIVTLAGQGGDLIKGASTYIMKPNEFLRLVSDSVSKWIIG